MVKSGKEGDNNLKKKCLCGFNQKLKQNKKRKICFKNKNCDHLGKDLYSRTTL